MSGTPGLPTRSFCVRFLGVDASFLVAAAVNLAVLTSLVELLDVEVLRSQNVTLRVWMVVIGASGGAASLLAFWLVCGPGRIAVRAAWASSLAWIGWLALSGFGRRIENNDVAIIAAVETQTLLIVLVVAGGLRLFGGWYFSRVVDGETGEIVRSARYQFQLSDLLIWTFVAGLLALAREWLWESRHLLSMDEGSYGILHAIRCGSAQCAAIVLAGHWLLMRNRRRLRWMFPAFVLITGLALLAARGPFASSFSDFATAVNVYPLGGFGCLFAVVVTLLPLRARGWRFQKRPGIPVAGQIPT